MESANVTIVCFRIVVFCFDFSESGCVMYRPPPFLAIEIIYFVLVLRVRFVRNILKTDEQTLTIER